MTINSLILFILINLTEHFLGCGPQPAVHSRRIITIQYEGYHEMPKKVMKDDFAESNEKNGAFQKNQT